MEKVCYTHLNGGLKVKAKVCNLILNVFLYLVFVLLCCAILAVITLLRIFDTFLDGFADGILLKVFAITSVLGIIITILCRKKMKYNWMLPLLLIVSIIITTAINYGVLYCAFDYISVYTREKWDKYPWERACMIDSLNEQYEFIGTTGQVVISILGEPDSTFERDGCTIYQYVVGDVFKERNAYDFILENDIVIDTSFSQWMD